jgi:vitamin B12 transporter
MGPLAPLRRSARSAGLGIAVILATLRPAAAAPAPADPSPADSLRPAPGPAAAHAAPRYRLSPVVVTAERVPVPLSRVPADVTVLGLPDLGPKSGLFVSDALRQVPGIDVRRAGAPGKLTDVRLRGADPRHTLILYDGIPLNGPWLGSFDFADLPASGFGRAEIVGGPVSSLYGSGAVGGVIQLFPDEGTAAPHLRGFAEYGEQATLRQGGEARGRLGRFSGSAALTHLSSDGLGARDAYDGTNGQLHLTTPVGSEGALGVSALATRGRKELPFDFVYDPGDTRIHEVRDPNNRETDQMAAGRVFAGRAVGPRARIEGEVSGLSGRIENRNEPDAAGGDYQRTTLDSRRGIASLRVRLAGAPGAVALLGAEYRTEHVTRDDESRFGGFPDSTRVDEGIFTRALYVQGHAEALGRLFADAGIRAEDHSRYGAYGVPRIAVGVAAPEAGMRFRGGFGRAFTAPTLTDLYYPGYGSPDLRPERSRTWEAGVDGAWFQDRVRVHATWHTTRFTDLIQSNSFYRAGNIGRARIEGEEYALELAPGRRLAAAVWAARLVTWNLAAGGALPKRPAWRTGAHARWSPAGGASLRAAWRWVDSVLDPFDFVAADGRLLAGPTPGYAVLDLGGSLSLSRYAPVELSLRVDNALDRAYSEVKGYPARGRALTLGLSVQR